jgi:hypothetical protein
MPRDTVARDVSAIDAELRMLATRRRTARVRGGPLPSIDVADPLLDERLRLTGCVAKLEELHFGRRCESAQQSQ